MSNKGFLGIDAGTQGLSVVLTNEDLEVIATGDGHYDMLPGQPDGHYIQAPKDWFDALLAALSDLRSKVGNEIDRIVCNIIQQSIGGNSSQPTLSVSHCSRRIAIY